ncbi:aldehyde dehydrogenase family protein [Streptomyces sp. 7N604]|uniref:aldehyde dehydrogenase family protein n=1 Tax=Streptomyces sp. 7N604 TaxID=3457415 RepID=UPI003FD53561
MSGTKTDSMDPGEKLRVVNPATGELIATVPAANAGDVTAAAKRAHRLFRSGVWSG